MLKRALLRHGLVPRLSFVALVCIFTQVTLAQAPQLTGAVSRKVHGTTNPKTFDVVLPLTGNTGIECRSSSSAQIVLTFDQLITSIGTAQVTAGSAVPGAATFLGNTVTVPLTSVANLRTITVRVNNVASDGGNLPAATVTFRTIFGDLNSDGRVSSIDVGLVKSWAELPITYQTFRADYNFSGNVSSTDVGSVKSRIETTVAGGATSNTPPAVSTIADQEAVSGKPTVGIPFTINDAESGPDRVALIASSSNPAIVPENGIVFSGNGDTRTVTITSAPGEVGPVSINVRVSDGIRTSTRTFTLNVTPSPSLFVALMRPQGGAQTTGAGVASLQLAGDETYATLRFNFGNLTTPEIAAHVHGPADPGTPGDILFDIDTAAVEPDGSRKWTFVQTGNHTVADQVAALKAGRTYINIHSSKYPDGEIRGHFNLATGSQAFTPPAPPPPLPTGPVTQQDAFRLLTQATFGPTTATIAEVMGYDGGIDEWITVQMGLPHSKMLDIIVPRRPPEGTAVTDDTFLYNAFWKLANTAPDQLRQRVTFALSEIFVVSIRSDEIAGRTEGTANYYDLLGRNAFGNFRTLLEEVTLNPMMGNYLDMRGNRKPDPARGTNPNENYAREILQLFSIGLNQVHPDGTLKLDADGLPISTYNQDVVVGFAHVFTGWDYAPPSPNYISPMAFNANNHSTTSKLLLNGVVLPSNQSGPDDLREALDNIFNHPNVGPFMARLLIQRLVCSNPSPGYIYRVAQKFNDNGSGVRGDLGAVVRAVLTDYEARSTNVLVNQGFGKQKEPILRVSHAMRAFKATSTSGNWDLDSTNTPLGQAVLRAETVFNFFEPDYVPAGEIGAAGLFAPEFQITTDTTAITSSNMMESGVRGGSGFSNDIRLNLTDEQTLITTSVDSLLDHLNVLLMGGAMPSDMRLIIRSHVNSLPNNNGTDRLNRAKAAIHLIVTSPQFVTQR